MFKLIIEEDLPDIRDVSARAVKRANRDAGMDVLAWFLQERMPKRFDGTVGRELGWVARDAKYEKRKAREGRSWVGIPQRLTGKAAAQARQASRTVGESRMTMTLRGLNPGYRPRRETTYRRGEYTTTSPNGRVKVHNKDSTPGPRPNLLQELRQFTESEEQAIATGYAQHKCRYLLGAIRQSQRKRRLEA